MKDNKRKIFVLGLDGASWSLLNPLMDQGVMPNLQKIVRHGSSGVLQSTIPPYTAPAWVSCVTGVNPGKHGIFGFTLKSSGLSGTQFVSSQDVQVPKLWHHINNAGKTVGLINIPITYPAEPVSGFMVPCFMTPLGKQNYTHPVSIYKDFLVPMNYVINVRIAGIRHFSEDILLKTTRDIKNSTQKRYEVMQALQERYHPDFLMIVFTCMDKIQHKFWKYLYPGDPMYATPSAQKARPHLISIYRQMDDIIGEVQKKMDEHSTLYLVSDHGFGPKKKVLFVNKWLKKNGFLRVKKLGVLQHRFLSRCFKKLNFSKRNIDILDNPVHRFIDFKNSYFLGSDPYEQGIYYIGGSDGREYWDKIENLKERLLESKDPETGMPLLYKVHHRNDLYVGDYTWRAPDIVLQMNDHSVGWARGYPLRCKILTPVSGPAGIHHPAGIFAAYGRDIVPETRIDASITDVAPTILYNVGLPVPKYMDGRVLKEIFSSDFQDAYQVHYTDILPSPGEARAEDPSHSDNDKAEIARRLRDLGYFD